MSTVLATDSPAYLAYQAYDLPGNLLALEPLGNGLINKTYRIQQGDGQGWQGSMSSKKSTSLSFQMCRALCRISWL